MTVVRWILLVALFICASAAYLTLGRNMEPANAAWWICSGLMLVGVSGALLVCLLFDGTGRRYGGWVLNFALVALIGATGQFVMSVWLGAAIMAAVAWFEQRHTDWMYPAVLSKRHSVGSVVLAFWTAMTPIWLLPSENIYRMLVVTALLMCAVFLLTPRREPKRVLMT